MKISVHMARLVLARLVLVTSLRASSAYSWIPGGRTGLTNAPPTRASNSRVQSYAPWQSSRYSKSKTVFRRTVENGQAAPPIDNSGQVADSRRYPFPVKKKPSRRAYWEVLRPQNIPASFGLVAAGALLASHEIAALADLKVLLTGWAAAAISVGSCVLNDWFDIELDRINKPDRPLVTGEVVPEHALAMGITFLLSAVASASAISPTALQATIVASVVLTAAYTPVLKPLPIVKNLVVAAVVAAAIAAGGLATGVGIGETWAPTWLTFFVIAHREILMDLSDVDGDSSTGVMTLPVVIGREASLGLACSLLTAGVTGTAFHILTATAGLGKYQTAAASLAALFVLPLYGNLYSIARSAFDSHRLSHAVGSALWPLALVLGLMSAIPTG